MAIPTTAFISAGEVKAVLLNTSPIKWALRDGTEPVIETFDVRPEDSIALQKITPQFQGNFSLTMITNHGNITFKKLSLQTDLPGDNPFIAKLQMADRRWVWSYKHIIKRLNMRRRVGFRRFNNARAIDARELQDITERLQFAIYSLNEDKGEFIPWDGTAAAIDLLTSPEGLGKDILGIPKNEVIIDAEVQKILKNFPIEDLQIDDPGNMAIGKLLSSYPNVGLFVDTNGFVILYMKNDGREIDVLNEMGAALPTVVGTHKVGQGHYEFITGNFTRPREVHVLFTREVEVRFDFQEKDSADDVDPNATNVEGQAKVNKDRIIENVLSNPDFELALTNPDRTVTQGTWIPILESLRTWKDLAKPEGSLLKNFDLQTIRRGLVPGVDVWGPLHIAGIRKDPEPDWAGRIAAIQQHYRKTFRINKEWMDRIFELKDYLVGTIDPTAGTRAPAMAFMNATVISSQRSLFLKANRNERIPFAFRYSGYPKTLNDKGFGLIDKDTVPAPADVTVVDNDQGIIDVRMLIDPARLNEVILPGTVDNVPVENRVDGAENPTAWNVRTRSGELAELSPEHKTAIIMTAIPASPNDSRQLHRVIINPKRDKGALGALLPGNALIGLENSFGPIQEIRVGAGVETARVRWSDDRAQDIEKIFGTRDGIPNLKGLVVNDKDQAKIDAPSNRSASLRSIALAIAARIYSDEHDRFLGSKSGPMVGTLRPRGAIEEITFIITASGEGGATIQLPQSAPELNFFSLLDGGTRAIIMKTIGP